MKKIIAAFDGLKYSTDTTNVATYIARATNSHLVGVFLDDLAYNSYNVYQLLVKKDVPERELVHYRQKDKISRDKAVAAFSKACDRSKLNYSIHRERYTALRELLHESIFADLLVVDKKETFTHYKEKLPTRFIRDLLPETQCPVLLAPSGFQIPDKVIMLYDGQPSSVYAIKMFSYLFPFLAHLDIEIVTVKYLNADRHLPDNKLFKEFIKRHFRSVKYKVLKGGAEVELPRYLSQQEGNPLIVLGAYSRGMVSRWFRLSMADLLMMLVDFPLFIAHNRA